MRDLTRAARLWRGMSLPALKDPKFWIKVWAKTERGRDNLSDLIDLGYVLESS